ncbi:endolytic transglycosylase MltG [Phenylobacterium terrae]|uniref:Endolytic murein transglycosylase n=1 Tax=Phenylobacterium terrae TaxID=2665495 RepID=A0ABW4N545_9CAUL
MSRRRFYKRKAGLTPFRRLAIVGTSAAVTAAAVLGLVLAWGLWTYYGPGPGARQGDETIVILRRGAGVREIANTLETSGVIGSSAIFTAAAQVTGAAGELKAGEYRVASRASLRRVLDDIRNGRVVRRFVTIPEGVTSETVVAILNANPVLEGVVSAPPEGSVLPETYQIERGDDRAVVLKRMMDAQEALLAQLWAKRQPGLPFDTPEEAVTLASVVEKETGVASERPRVAAVFVNRLRRGMRLESDPTIIYGLTRGRPLGRGIRASELATATPYNTYLVDGLPPTPIANPGRASLAAVLDPPKTDELFFVADGTGGHVFAKTYEEHTRNVAKWRALEKARAAQATTTVAPAVAP